MEFLDPSSRKKSSPKDLPPDVPFRKRQLEKIGKILRLPFKTPWRRRVVFGTLFILVFSIGLAAAAGVYFFFQVRGFTALGSELGSAISSRDLPRIEASLNTIDSRLWKTEAAFAGMYILRVVPRVGDYYRDGSYALKAMRLAVDTGDEIMKALDPYKEILGLFSGFGNQITLEQRLQNLFETLPALSGKLDLVWTGIGSIREELGKINPSRYPEDFHGIRVRFWLEEAQNILEDTAPLVSRGREILKIVPSLAGSPRRTYLVIFQNDAELRATGGFITGFSLVTVEDGLVKSNDFHSGAYFAAHYPPELGYPPNSLRKYLGVRKWHFQDSNYYPDFPTTAKIILEVWKKSGLKPVSGVIGVNTQIASDILNLTGPIRIPGYDRDFSSRSKLPASCRGGGKDFTSENLVCRLEIYVEKAPRKKDGSTPTTEERKAILDLVSDAVLKKILESPAEIWPQLVDFVFEHLEKRNLLIFSPKSDEQSLFGELGYTGKILKSDGDYLHVNDSNFGGKKTNLFLEESVSQSLVKNEDGTWRKTVSIDYYNPEPYDNWLSANYRDFVRIYVPKGSRLVGVEGEIQIWTHPETASYLIANPEGWTEAGKTVFGAFFMVSPQVKHTLTFVYDLPKGTVGGREYSLYVQRQSGTNIGLVKVQIGDTMESVNLETDREITIQLEK